MKLLTKLFLFSFFAINSTKAQFDQLEPVEGYFSSFNYEHDYFSNVRKILTLNLSNEPIARVIVLPSFESEYLISIENSNDTLFLIYKRAKSSIWNNKNNDNVQFVVFRKIFNKDISNKINELFYLAIIKAKYNPNPILGLDGTRYYFITYRSPLGFIAGQTWSPLKGTKMYDLVDLSELLEKIIFDSDSEKKNNEINKKVDLLIYRFNNE